MLNYWLSVVNRQYETGADIGALSLKLSREKEDEERETFERMIK